MRCTSTGRKCDGYEGGEYPAKTTGQNPTESVEDVVGGLTIPGSTLRSPSLTWLSDVGNPPEVRLFEYFQLVAAPMIAGYFDQDFWTLVVPQASSSEPAVRHAALAISLALGSPFHSGDDSRRLCLQQCNKAIRAVLNVQDKGIILLTCVLFICTEFVQRQVRRSLAHLEQGLRILESVSEPTSLTRTLAPFFCRLRLVPMLFGHDLRSTLFDRWTRDFINIPTRFESVEPARHSLSAIWVLSLSCMRAAEAVRFGTLPISSLPDSWYSQFGAACDLLRKWWIAYQNLIARSPDTDVEGLRLLHAQYITIRIWVDVSLSPSQMSFDKHQVQFESIVNDCSFIIERGKPVKESGVSGLFIFDSGIIPLLYFAGAKCRSPATRLAALQLLDRLAQAGLQESLWYAAAMRDLVRGIIEHEHECSMEVLSGKLLRQEMMDLPPNERRVWDFSRQDLSPPPESGDWAAEKASKVVVKLRDASGWHAQQSYVP